MADATADDYVLATGVSTSVWEFVEKTYKYLGVDLVWRGEKTLFKNALYRPIPERIWLRLILSSNDLGKSIVWLEILLVPK